MKYRLVDLLQPITENSQLRVKATQQKETPFKGVIDKVKCSHFCAFKNKKIGEAAVTAADCARCFSQEIMEGELVSDGGSRYPITRGLPRLLPDDLKGFLERNQETFSLEWKMFKFGERNWGQTIDHRMGLFLKGMNVTREEIKGKVILDAGCGSGLLSMAMAEHFGMEVVALDLAQGIEQAYEKNQNPFLYFLQGSVLTPPLRSGIVDYIYCCGVLIALPNTREGLHALTRILKPGGRYYTWHYHPVDRAHHPNDYYKMKFYVWIRNHITTKLPIKLQYLLYLALIVPYVIKRDVCNLFRKVKDDRTWREKMQALVDEFSPVYQNRHDESEVMGWYREEGLVNNAIGYKGLWGFSIRGDVPEKPR